ncbi:hypothetical protein [Streptomyces sp. NPDC048106]|uniref:hypothetical protein n=1 Tax=Streptomyces sp. NPDC048106 TaxID=3155750 RepID=UPI003456FE05
MPPTRGAAGDGHGRTTAWLVDHPLADSRYFFYRVDGPADPDSASPHRAAMGRSAGTNRY